MSQSAPKTDGARTRGRASTLTPSEAEDEPTTITQGEPDTEGDTQIVSMANIDTKLDAIMNRLESLNKLESDLADISISNTLKMNKFEEDNKILREGIARLTGMLEESE